MKSKLLGIASAIVGLLVIDHEVTKRKFDSDLKTKRHMSSHDYQDEYERKLANKGS